MAQVTNDTDDDDDFGDFSTAEKPVSNGQHDDFGAFASSNPQNNPQDKGGKVEIEKQEPVTPEEDEDDDWGDFGSAPTSMTNLASGGDGKNGAKNDAESAPVVSAPKANTSPDSSSEGGYETAAEEEEDDEFGEFDGPAATPAPAPVPVPAPGPTPAPVPVTATAPATATEETLDGFGDFGSVPDTSEPTSAVPIESRPTEESFGDFNGPASGTEDAVGKVASANSNAAAPTPVAATTENPDDDDFGDFGAFDSAPASGTQDKVAAPSAAGVSEKPEDDDFGEFGAFDRAPAGTEDNTAAPPAPAVSEKPDDDDFGDFGAFDSGPMSGTEDAAAPTPAPETTVEPGDDDFGDFGSAPASGTENATAPKPAQSAAGKPEDDDDDFGDFGDFDSAVAQAKLPEQHKETGSAPSPQIQLQPPQSSNSGFGASFGSQGSAPPAAEASDPVLLKAKTVLSNVFERFKPADSNDGGSDSSETIAVAGLTASMDSEYDGKSSEKLMKDFSTILEEMPKVEAPPVFIVAQGEGYSPNAHFSVPIDGESFGPSYGTQQLDIGMSQEQQVTVQSRTPTGANQTSARKGQPTQPTQTSATMVQLPPQTSTSLGTKQVDGDKLSERAQRLLRQVPDLSFMLQSKLWLPSNVK